MLEIMTQLPVQMIQAINGLNIYSLKNKLPKFMDITQFYKKRPTADEVFKLFHVLLTLWLFGEDTNNLILQKYRLGETITVDTHQHPLVLSNGEMRKYQADG